MPCDKTIILFVILKRIKNKISSYFTIKEMSKKVKYDILIINKDTYLIAYYNLWYRFYIVRS